MSVLLVEVTQSGNGSHWGAAMAQWLERRTRHRKVAGRVLAGAAGEISSPVSTFRFNFYFGISESVPAP